MSGTNRRIMIELEESMYQDVKTLKPDNLYMSAFYHNLFMIGLIEYCKSLKKGGRNEKIKN